MKLKRTGIVLIVASLMAIVLGWVGSYTMPSLRVDKEKGKKEIRIERGGGSRGPRGYRDTRFAETSLESVKANRILLN